MTRPKPTFPHEDHQREQYFFDPPTRERLCAFAASFFTVSLFDHLTVQDDERNRIELYTNVPDEALGALSPERASG